MEYYRSGRVKIVEGDEFYVDAEVRGKRTYDVTIERYTGDVQLRCTCPHEDLCKHLWAVMLAAESRGLITDEMDEGLDLFEPGAPVIAPYQIPKPPPPKPDWERWLDEAAGRVARRPPFEWPPDRQIVYILSHAGPSYLHVVRLSILTRAPRKKTGGWLKPQPLKLAITDIDKLPDPADRSLIHRLSGTQSESGFIYNEQASSVVRLDDAFAASLMPDLCATGRAFVGNGYNHEEVIPLQWSGGDPFRYEIGLTERGDTYRAEASLVRGGERYPLSRFTILTGALVVRDDGMALPTAPEGLEWIAELRARSVVDIPKSHANRFVAKLLPHAESAVVRLPDDLRVEERRPPLQPRLVVREAEPVEYSPETPRADLFFGYDGVWIPHAQPGQAIVDEGRRLRIVRDPAGEQGARDKLNDLLKRDGYGAQRGSPWLIPWKKVFEVAGIAMAAGWEFVLSGSALRQPGEASLQVTTGIDWFDLEAEISYGDARATLPELLQALKSGRNMVQLSDGSFGLIPEEWVARLSSMSGMGDVEDGKIRFRKNQAGLLDAMLASEPKVRVDAAFERARARLREFEGVRAAPQPAGFEGALREYQREGLGWMQFLREFGFGGCLADDMGVGKTAQVLALLETRRAARAAGEPIPPSLVVMPRSLIFNWKAEAARFTPNLRVLDHTGAGRDLADAAGADLVITTYGTLRRDIVAFREVVFDYVVLDEAQAIKNAAGETSKAARLLRAHHRLALSGTPIENHLGELWSLFEFLNPGMLGAAKVFQGAAGAMRNPDEATRRMLAHALRPFILRRTKEQVARELPPKTEQVVYCPLEPEQRRLYNQLRDHYRASLLGRIDRHGLAKSKMHVLEALLRLRQAACHPGLIDKERSAEPSAKLDVLLPRIAEVVDEGHKALVFSQFTSLLAIVRDRLEQDKVPYAYLDGQTRDRQAVVERFQNDPACPVFLLSLKAGGVGLNLTAADYVFLLDPWWNPAVEAQAMDRTHRIGQTRHVFAYRLIAQETVEEKVLQLQAGKRDLAASIVGDDPSLIRGLKREDLEILLS